MKDILSQRYESYSATFAFSAILMSLSVIDERSHMLRKIPSEASYRSAGVSNSAICPASSTQMRSYPIIVRKRSATGPAAGEREGTVTLRMETRTGNAQDGAVCELCRDSVLDLPVCLVVDGSYDACVSQTALKYMLTRTHTGRLIQDQDLAVLDQRTRQRYKRTL